MCPSHHTHRHSQLSSDVPVGQYISNQIGDPTFTPAQRQLYGHILLGQRFRVAFGDDPKRSRTGSQHRTTQGSRPEKLRGHLPLHPRHRFGHRGLPIPPTLPAGLPHRGRPTPSAPRPPRSDPPQQWPTHNSGKLIQAVSPIGGIAELDCGLTALARVAHGRGRTRQPEPPGPSPRYRAPAQRQPMPRRGCGSARETEGRMLGARGPGPWRVRRGAVGVGLRETPERDAEGAIGFAPVR